MIGPKYSFYWTPKPINNDRRSTQAQKGSATDYRNVMYDKRIIRGSNYASTIITECSSFNKASENLRRRNVLRKKVLLKNQRNVIGSPPPVPGRRHETIQTEKYLEELLATSVENKDTQTDLFLERPLTPPPYIPTNTGIDVGTCIEKGDLPENLIQQDIKEDLFVEQFVESCIIDMIKEVQFDDIKNEASTSQKLQGHIAKILPKLLGKIEPDINEEKKQQLCSWLNDQVPNEVAEIVDSEDFLLVIIEEILKQHNERYTTVLSGVEARYDTNKYDEERNV